MVDVSGTLRVLEGKTAISIAHQTRARNAAVIGVSALRCVDTLLTQQANGKRTPLLGSRM
jgi:hypothetical protein